MKTIITVITILLLTSACSPSEPNTTKAKQYQVIGKDDFSFPGRIRIQYNIISPNSSNFSEFAHTAIRAALDKQKETRANVIYIFIEPSKKVQGFGSSYAIARYAPDNGGNSGDQNWTWEVEAVEKPLTETQLDIEEIWFTNRDKFQKNGVTDEPSLKKFIAQELKMNAEDVSLTFVLRNKYEVSQN